MIRKWKSRRSGWTSARLHLTFLMSAVSAASLDGIYIAQHSSTVKRQVTLFPTAEAACKDADAVVIATEWKEFLQLDWETIYAGMNKPAFVFDGRLIVDAEKLRKIGFKV